MMIIAPFVCSVRWPASAIGPGIIKSKLAVELLSHAYGDYEHMQDLAL